MDLVAITEVFGAHYKSTFTLHITLHSLQWNDNALCLSQRGRRVEISISSGSNFLTVGLDFQTRNTFCGTWYLPNSHVHNERTVPIIMAGCMAREREGCISTSGPKSDVTVVFLDPDFLYDAGISAIRP